MSKADKQIAKEVTDQFLKDMQGIYANAYYRKCLSDNVKRCLRMKRQKEGYGRKNK